MDTFHLYGKEENLENLRLAMCCEFDCVKGSIWVSGRLVTELRLATHPGIAGLQTPPLSMAPEISDKSGVYVQKARRYRQIDVEERVEPAMGVSVLLKAVSLEWTLFSCNRAITPPLYFSFASQTGKRLARPRETYTAALQLEHS